MYLHAAKQSRETVLRKSGRLFVGIYRDEILVTARDFYAAYAKATDQPKLHGRVGPPSVDHRLWARAPR